MSESDWITNPRRARSRLPKLARWLRQVSEMVNGAKFNLSVWGHLPEGGDPPVSPQAASRCGFEGCALGWAALEPSFRKAGLRLGSAFGESRILVVHLAGEIADPYGSEYAGARFFGIEEDAAEALFGSASADWQGGGPQWFGDPLGDDPDDPDDPVAAAQRIERFCRDVGIPLEAS